MTDLAQGRPKWRQLGCMVKETCKQAWGQVCIQNDGVCIQNDGFSIQNGWTLY